MCGYKKKTALSCLNTRKHVLQTMTNDQGNQAQLVPHLEILILHICEGRQLFK